MNASARTFLLRLCIAIAASTVNLGGVAFLFGWHEPLRAEPLAATTASTVVAPCPSPTPVQRRILDAASKGAGALRGFIWITRGIYQLDFVETVQWVDSYRARRLACRQPVATHPLRVDNSQSTPGSASDGVQEGGCACAW